MIAKKLTETMPITICSTANNQLLTDINALKLTDSAFTINVRNIVINCRIDNIEFLTNYLESELDIKSAPENSFKIYYAILTYYRRMIKNDKYADIVSKFYDSFSMEYQLHPLMLVSLSLKAKFESKLEDAVNYALKATESSYLGVNQNYADLVTSALEFEISLGEDVIEEAMAKLNIEIAKGNRYAKYFCTQGRLMYILDNNKYKKACELIEKAISLEDSNKQDYPIRISQYYNALVNIKINESKRRLLDSFSKTINEKTDELTNIIKEETDNTLDILDNQKSKYFEILAFFASMVALIVSTVNIAVNFKSPKEASSLLIVLAGILTFSYSVFRYLMTYNQEKKEANILNKTSIVIILSIFIIFLGIWIGLTNCI